MSVSYVTVSTQTAKSRGRGGQLTPTFSSGVKECLTPPFASIDEVLLISLLTLLHVRYIMICNWSGGSSQSLSGGGSYPRLIPFQDDAVSRHAGVGALHC